MLIFLLLLLIEIGNLIVNWDSLFRKSYEVFLNNISYTYDPNNGKQTTSMKASAALSVAV